jgi:hypothetical protein
MELAEIKSLWQSYDRKLEKSLQLNLRCLELIQAQKVKSKLKPLFWLRTAETLVHVVVVYWLITFLFRNFTEWPLALSALSLLVFFGLAMINGIRQLIIIKQMDYSDDIITIQSSLVLLRTHIVDYVKLTFLALPTWLAYPIVGLKALGGIDIAYLLHGNWWTGQIIFTILSIPVCIWLYSQVSYQNIHKAWVRFIIEKSAGNTVSKAMEFIHELEALKKSTL